MILVHLFFFLLTGCNSTVTMPNISAAREGDLVLTHTGSLTSCLFTLISQSPDRAVKPQYSHIEILLKDSKGQWVLGGVGNSHVRTVPLDKIIQSIGKLAIVRPAYTQEQIQTVVTKSKQWFADPQFLDAEFIYTFEDTPGRTDAFYCVSFINELYRQCRLPAPMPPYRPTYNRMWEHINRLGHLPPDRTINASVSLFDQPEHKLLLRWQNPKLKPEFLAMNNSIITITSQWYEEGWQLKQSNRADLLLKISPYPERIHNVARLRISLRQFQQDVIAAWDRMRRRHMLRNEMPDAHDSQFKTVCLNYRDRYFEYVGHDSGQLTNQSSDSQ